MSSPGAQRDHKKEIEIVFSMIAEVTNRLEKGQKPGDATISTASGSKDEFNKSIENAINGMIQAGVENNQCGYDKETKTGIRVLNGKVLKVKEVEVIYKAYEDRKKQNKINREEQETEK